MAQPKPHLQLCVFDTRRGCREGQEAERVLAFYPPGTPEHVQVKTAGLAQALATFAAGFGDHAAQQGVMEGECNRWVLRQCEPSLWLLLVVSKAWATPSCPHAALQALLGDLHALFSLLHGPLEPLLQRDPTAALARACLAPFTVAAGARLGTAGWRQEAARLRNPLGPMHQMPLLRLPNAVFLEVQAAADELMMVTFPGGQRLVTGVMAMWQGHLVWSTLPPPDSRALHSLAGRALLQLGRRSGTPRRGDSSSGRRSSDVSGAASYGASPSPARSPSPLPGAQAGTPQPAASEQSSPASTAPATPRSASAGSSEASGPSSSGRCLSAPEEWVLTRSGFIIPRQQPQQQQQQPGPSSGSTPPPTAAPAITLAAAVVHLQQGGRCLMLPYASGPLLVLTLLQEHAVLDAATLSPLASALHGCCADLQPLLARCMPTADAACHIQGHRYQYSDEACGVVRVSPADKVSTLSQRSLAALAALQNQLHPDGPDAGAALAGGDGAAWAAGSSALDAPEGIPVSSLAPGSAPPPPPAGMPSTMLPDELICQSSDDCWISHARAPGWALWAASSKVPDPRLPGAHKHAQALLRTLNS